MSSSENQVYIYSNFTGCLHTYKDFFIYPTKATAKKALLFHEEKSKRLESLVFRTRALCITQYLWKKCIILMRFRI